MVGEVRPGVGDVPSEPARKPWYLRTGVTASLAVGSALIAVTIGAGIRYSQLQEEGSHSPALPNPTVSPWVQLPDLIPLPMPVPRQPHQYRIEPQERTPELDDLEAFAEQTIDTFRQRGRAHLEGSNVTNENIGRARYPIHDATGQRIIGDVTLDYQVTPTPTNATRDEEFITAMVNVYKPGVTTFDPQRATKDPNFVGYVSEVTLTELPDGNWQGSIVKGKIPLASVHSWRIFSTKSDDSILVYPIPKATPEDFKDLKEAFAEILAEE